MVDKAGLYGGGLELTCILYEGSLEATAGTSVFVESGSLGRLSFVYASEIKEGDFVTINLSTDNDYDACGGLPVVSAATAALGFIGIVKSQPVWHKIPTSAATYNTWATELSNGHYRVATVVMPGVSMALRGVTQATDITCGAPVSWSVANDGWIDDGTAYNGCFSFHDGGADAQNLLVGIGAAGYAPGGSDTDVCGHGVVG